MLCEDADPGGQGRGAARLAAAACATLLTFDDLAELEAEGARFKAEHPSALDDAIAAIDEDDLFTLHLHLGHDRARRRAAWSPTATTTRWSSVIDHLPSYVRDDDLMLLYLPLAHNFGRLMHLTGPYVGYTIAFLPDPLQTAEALADGAPDRAAERAARVREDPHRGRRRDRRDDRRQAPPGRLVARASVARSARREEAGQPVGGCCS